MKAKMAGVRGILLRVIWFALLFFPTNPARECFASAAAGILRRGGEYDNGGDFVPLPRRSIYLFCFEVVFIRSFVCPFA